MVKDVQGPEGALVLNGDIFYVSWVKGALYKLSDKKSVVINATEKCYHNGLAPTKNGSFLIACGIDPGLILEVDNSGKEIRRWAADNSGAPFLGGANDVVTTQNGGAYATTFGPFKEHEPPSSVEGKIYYLAPGSNEWKVVAADLNYANGIAVSPDQKTLYVSETVANSLKRFTINADGTLSDRQNFAWLSVLAPGGAKSPWLGPDSMKVDHSGNIYIAQWHGGKVLKISPDGKLLHTFNVEAGKGTTNVALDAGEQNLYVTVVKDPDDPEARGEVVKIALK